MIVAEVLKSLYAAEVCSKIIKKLHKWSKCNGNCPCQNFRSKNSFKSDVALKHAPDERPVRKADQKSEIAPRERRREEKT